MDSSLLRDATSISLLILFLMNQLLEGHQISITLTILTQCHSFDCYVPLFFFEVGGISVGKFGRLMVRSDSSRQIRSDLVKVHSVIDVNNEISIDKYFILAGQMFSQAQASLNENLTARSYIYWKQFAIFVAEKLTRHQEYKSQDMAIKSKREWCAKALEHAIVQLENIAGQMDREEDIVLASQTPSQSPQCEISVDDLLIDEFDPNPLSVDPNITPAIGSGTLVNPAQRLLEDNLGPTGENSESLGNNPPPRSRLTEVLHLLIPKELTSSVSPSPPELYPSLPPSQATESHTSGLMGSILSIYELEILNSLWKEFQVPAAHRTLLAFSLPSADRLQQQQISFYRFDYHVSFLTFLDSLNPDLKKTRPAIETNRFICYCLDLI
jgi:hypothetical protein